MDLGYQVSFSPYLLIFCLSVSPPLSPCIAMSFLDWFSYLAIGKRMPALISESGTSSINPALPYAGKYEYEKSFSYISIKINCTTTPLKRR